MAGNSKIRSYLLLIFLIIIGVGGYWVYVNFFKTSVKLNKDYEFIYIRSAFDMNDVIYELKDKNILKETDKFEWIAKKMELDQNIHPGKYRILNGMTHRQIINLIKYNKQEKIKLTLNSQIHNMEEFILYLDDKLELDEEQLEGYFEDPNMLERDFNLAPNYAFATIIPQIYELSWATSLPDLINELRKTYNAFWTKERLAKAKKNTKLTIGEVITLASIVQNESYIPEEQQKIAGVYLNRINKGMLLQADPTLVFANKLWGVQRIYDKDKGIDSPYNTYKYKGLPPGPICLVKTQVLLQVVDLTKHKYLFFCAKPELNGYSDFSETYEQHQRYATAYQRTMNKKGIK
ncbi:MAG: endolytic transglycosylase MltG [Bacteroidota bacterium]|nr:endolytic transglycosylase MltG [Bacteroidota bacterium]